ncbi:MAG: PKD domain-containing protein [Chloroflexi bacterium]|nr:PKD domain-containing protein [Chloroflexota bacterium]MBM3175531.1 PKD domain-containing protein [Chloroflexota bacterium]
MSFEQNAAKIGAMLRCYFALLALLAVTACARIPQPTTATPPVADFKATVTQGETPLSVSFTDLSTGQVTYWHWDFGDGHFSSQKAASHTYTSPGVYTVSLAVMGPGGSDVETKADYIGVKGQVISWEEAASYIGQQKTVEGIVVSSYYAHEVKGQPTFLNFHEPHQGYFKCVIWGSDRPEFLKKFPPNPEMHFLNKRLRVTGTIKEYPAGSGIPEIIIKKTWQVEVIGE